MPASIIRFLTLSLILLYGCGITVQKRTDITGTWKLQDVVATTGTPDFEQTVELKKLLKEGSQVSLFKDKTFSLVTGKGEYVSGNWSMEENNIELIPSTGGGQDLKIQREEKNGKSQLVWKNKANRTSLLFAPNAISLESDKDDPFHPSNNKWRVKPKEKENEIQVRERMKNYIRHFALILKAAQDRKQQIVSFEYSMGPVQVYSGAIGIYPFYLVPEEWKKCFFDEMDADLACQMFNKALNEGSYRGASAGNWIEDDYNILLSIYGDL